MFEIDHLGIAVRSLEEALAFYVRDLGMKAGEQEIVEGEHVTVAMLPTGAADHGPRMELLEATDGESPIAKFIEKRGPGLHHIALSVDDLETTVQRLAQAGAKLVNEPRRGAGGHLYVFVHPASTRGVLLELIQREEH